MEKQPKKLKVRLALIALGLIGAFVLCPIANAISPVNIETSKTHIVDLNADFYTLGINFPNGQFCGIEYSEFYGSKPTLTCLKK